MSDIGKRIGQLSQMRRKHLTQLRANCAAPEKDRGGSASNSLAGTLRFLAVADFILDKDLAAFRFELSEAAELRRKLFGRFDAGEPVSPSYVSMSSYKALFNVLAAGDKSLAMEFSQCMGGREVIENEYDRPFDMTLGYTLKTLLATDDTAAARYLDAFETICQESANTDFKGYAIVLRAILNQDVSAANEGFAELLFGHKRQCKNGGLFKDSEDEVLCVWGVGLANLARMRGLAVQPNDPLIPVDLLI